MHPETILYLSASAKTGGAELSLLSLLAHLDRTRYTPEVILPDQTDAPLLQMLREIEVPCHSLPLVNLHKTTNPFKILDYYKGLRKTSQLISKIAAETKSKIIHANTTKAALQMLFSGKMNSKVIWHNRDLALPRFADKFAAKNCTHAIALSQAVANKTQKFMPPALISVIPGGIELAPFTCLPNQAQAREQLKLPPEGKVLLCVSNYAAWKRQDLFLQTLAEVRRTLPKTTGIIVGQTFSKPAENLKTKIERQAHKLDISASVHFLTVQPREMAKIYSASDLLVHFAENEPFGRVIVEAIASGLPVITTDKGGPVEIIRQFKQTAKQNDNLPQTICLPQPQKNTADAVQAIIKIISSPKPEPELARHTGLNGMSVYAARLIAKQIMELYSRL